MNDDGWIGSIRSAGGTEELLRLAKAYVATWEPARLALLPPDCRPPPLQNTNDIAAYALTLVRRQMSPDAVPDRPALEAMAGFFAAAHVRLAEIFAGPRPSMSRDFLRQLHLEDE
jgi:hypothetical protein